MFDSILQISLNWGGWPVWVPLGTGLTIGLIYALASAARRAR
ncbi:MAG TPA: hypothetical protein VN704_04320 [Verrucomicrobiae bacterium]|nr:hypothetical protein [Verrucomicrobiae bacterium]